MLEWMIIHKLNFKVQKNNRTIVKRENKYDKITKEYKYLIDFL
jgi:hypothetical protein